MRDTQRRDLHAEITAKIIAAITTNPGNPQMPWRRSGKPLWMPENALTKNRYAGINVCRLVMYGASADASLLRWSHSASQRRDNCGTPTFGIFAALAEFERDLISERTKAGLNSARARGRRGGAKPKIAPYALAGVIAKADQASIARDKEFSLAKAAAELGVHRSTLWRSRRRAETSIESTDAIL